MELEPYVRRRCGELLDGFIGEDEFDVAEAFAVQLPLDVISELLNIPHELRNDIHVQSDRVSQRGDSVDLEEVIGGSASLFELYLGLIQERRKNPIDDIINILLETEVIDDEDAHHDAAGCPTTRPPSASWSWVSPVTRRSRRASPTALSPSRTSPTRRPGCAADPALSAAGRGGDPALRPALAAAGAHHDHRRHPARCRPSRQARRSCSSRGRRPATSGPIPTLTGWTCSREADPSTMFFGYGIHRCLGRPPREAGDPHRLRGDPGPLAEFRGRPVARRSQCDQ